MPHRPSPTYSYLLLPSPTFSERSPQFFFRTANVTGSVQLAEDKQMVMPGDNAEVPAPHPHRTRTLPAPRHTRSRRGLTRPPRAWAVSRAWAVLPRRRRLVG